MTYHKLFSLRKTPQNQPIMGTTQVANRAGGYVWPVDAWTQLDRFLILGSDSGSYYANARVLTQESAEAVLTCLSEDGLRTVARIVEISGSGRAPKNDPALFALALAAGMGDVATRRAALDALPKVARIGTHLFHFLAYVEGFRGWGRSLRRAVANWYTTMPVEKLAYQVVKYQQRDGWSHRDALRLAHPSAPNARYDALFYWVTQGWPEVGDAPHPDEALRTIWAFERAKTATTEEAIIELIHRYDLPWEAIPTAWLKHASVWQVLLPKLPLTALLRNLARLTANGALGKGQTHLATQLRKWAKVHQVSLPYANLITPVVQRLTNREQLRRARIHPIALLSALMTYTQGQGARGKLTWEPIPAVVDALDKAFYLSFGNIKPTGKRIVLALDVSGSMAWGTVAGVPGLTPRVASAAMVLVTVATEPHAQVVAFSNKMVRLQISARQRLDDVINRTTRISFGGTDCALPMLWALKHKVEADVFVIYTDSETWYGKVHPVQALQAYRQKMGIPAKLVVVGMLANSFSIADPNDAGMLDIVGFDTATPQVIADFTAH